MLIIEPADPADPCAELLLQQSHALMAALYRDEDNFALDVAALRGEGITFFAARRGPDMIGCAALAEQPGYGEVKSMFIDPDARGLGVGAALLRQLEDHARTLNLPCLRLETGEELTAAIRLYERFGFVRRGAFGNYPENGVSVFMEKLLN